MKLNANYSRKSYNGKGDIELTLTIPKQYHTQIDKLDTERIYELDIKERSNQRTLAQNNLIWALMIEIDKKENGLASESGVNDIYMNLIKMARIQVEYWQGLEEMKKALEGGRYRVVDIVEKRQSGNDVETCIFACYLGSSSFDKKQLSDFVETILNYASKIGLEITYYNEGLKNLIENN